ncbi:MAG: hypothetical protein R3350_04935, partial [Saprospiraceae bacterium]|nr:hypothetical protein [Saprospiraceae bacterium]
MKNSKLISLLSSFSASEMSRFCDFVASPFFNKREELLPMIDYLADLAPDFPEEKVRKEVVFRAIFPDRKFDKKQMGYLMNYLSKLGEQFLGVSGCEADEIQFELYTLREFVVRKLEKHYNFQRRKLKRVLEDSPQESERDYYYQYQFSRIASEHFISSKTVRRYDENLQLASDRLDDYYFLNKLRFSCEMLNRRSILSAEYETPFVEEVSNHLLRREERRPLTDIYLQIFESLNHQGSEFTVQQLLATIQRQSEKVAVENRREIYLYAINICAQQIRKGKEELLPVALQLYKDGISDKSLFDGEYLSHWTYNNVVKLALRLRRFDWTESFIHR